MSTARVKVDLTLNDLKMIIFGLMKAKGKDKEDSEEKYDILINRLMWISGLITAWEEK